MYKQKNAVRHIFIILSVFATAFAFAPRRAAAQSSHDNYIYEDESFLDRLQDVQTTNASPFADLPPDHWAYKAVKRLADAGLLNGYKGELFRGDQVVTRYEMAMLVAKLLDGYSEWNHNGGRVSREEYTTISRGAGDDGRPYPYTGAPLRAISPPSAVISPTRRVSVDLPSLGSMALDKTTPKTVGDMKNGDKDNATLTEDQIKEIVKTTVLKELPFTKKDFDALQKLVNEFKGELKDIKKDLSKEIKETNRISLQNKKAINSLQEENERFKITGNNKFFWNVEGPITGDGCVNEPYNKKDLNESSMNARCNMRTANLTNQLNLDFTSKPDKGIDLTVGGTLTANTKLGGKRQMRKDKKKAPDDNEIEPGLYPYTQQQAAAQYKGYLEGTNTALSLTNIFVNYNGKNDAKHPKNFWMKSLYLGYFSAPLASPMTVFGNKLQGLTTTLQLNKYGVTLFGARERLHQHELLTTPDNLPDPTGLTTTWQYRTTFYNEDQHDRYKYGASVSTSLFGNPASMFNVSKVFMYDDTDTNYPGCETGRWLNLNFSFDEYTYKLPDSDYGATDLFCLPPVKNSVSSVFLMYPVMKNTTVMAEYAHSTYYKPYYRLLKPYDTFKTSANPSGKVDVTNMGDKFASWWESREENNQDDGFLVMFNYTKGPLTIFPLGVIHLGPNLQTDLIDNLGQLMGGSADFDLSQVSFLPITIKSMDGLMTSVKHEIQGKDKISTTFVAFKENKPMYFDPGGMSVGVSDSAGTRSALGILLTAITRLNNRTSQLQMKVWSTEWLHYLSDKLTFKMKYTKVGAMLPNACLDGNVVEIKNSVGTTIDKGIGNGITDCVNDTGSDGGDVIFGLKFRMDTQQYELGWQTSKRTNATTGLKITDKDLTLKFTKAVEDIVKDLFPKGKIYQLYEDVTYKLTNSTRLRFSYLYTYDRYPEGLDTYTSTMPKAWKFPVIDYQKFLFTVETNF